MTNIIGAFNAPIMFVILQSHTFLVTFLGGVLKRNFYVGKQIKSIMYKGLLQQLLSVKSVSSLLVAENNITV